MTPYFYELDGASTRLDPKRDPTRLTPTVEARHIGALLSVATTPDAPIASSVSFKIANNLRIESVLGSILLAPNESPANLFYISKKNTAPVSIGTITYKP